MKKSLGRSRISLMRLSSVDVGRLPSALRSTRDIWPAVTGTLVASVRIDMPRASSTGRMASPSGAAARTGGHVCRRLPVISIIEAGREAARVIVNITVGGQARGNEPGERFLDRHEFGQAPLPQLGVLGLP